MNQFNSSLWGDEAWAVTLAVKSLPQIIATVAKDTSPPLYYLLLHCWLQIFGRSEIAIRSLSFLFFLGTAAAVFLIGKLLWDKKTGLLAALLTLANPFLFTYALEGRMYSLLALTTCWSVYFFLKKHRPGFILATTAALYTHHFAIFIVVFEGFWALREGIPKRSLLFRRLADFAPVFLLYLPWLYPLYHQTSLVGSGFWLAKPTLSTVSGTVIKLLVGSGRETLRLLALAGFTIVLAARRWAKDKAKSAFLLAWFWTPLILTYFISQFFQSVFYDRYLLITIPAITLLIASHRRKVSSLLLLAAIFLLTFLDCRYFLHPDKRPFRDLADFIKKEAPQLTLINYNAAAHHLWESKYYGLQAPIYSPQPLPFYTGTALMEKNDVTTTLPVQPIIGIIASSPVEEVKLNGYHMIKAKQFGQLSLLWMEKN
ncbi:MAG TPA: glycosyltransferase family 39 protein [Patescibacteria group bacterium]|nr:glycosyltransferase family 39 protein [Patescibacteria group bacterium]